MNGGQQEWMPLLDALRRCALQPGAAFYAPGHKRGQGTPDALMELMGATVFRADLPELPELDNLFAPQGVIREAQELAAIAFGAERTWFLANGSTCGIEAAVLATCAPGSKLILPRNVHQSAIAALILAGVTPVFVQPAVDPDWGMAHSVPPDVIAAALRQHPDAAAVMLVYPTYYGVCGEIEAIAQIVHEHHIPLLVDEAHGAHFGFHPDLPTPALAAGADLVVQSTHKLLGAMTQASMLHVQGNRVDPERLSRALQLVQSTSPSYLLLASLDAARQQMALQGRALMQQTLELAAIARSRLSQIPRLRVLNPPTSTTPGFSRLDLTRLTVNIRGLGITGFEADEYLHEQQHVTAELPGLHTLTFIISLGNKLEDIERLVAGFEQLAHHFQNSESRILNLPVPILNSDFEMVLTPREAFFAQHETVSLAEAGDRISAELVCPYPPGIPALTPGERVTRQTLAVLQSILQAGGVITGCADPELQTLKVVKV